MLMLLLLVLAIQTSSELLHDRCFNISIVSDDFNVCNIELFSVTLNLPPRRKSTQKAPIKQCFTLDLMSCQSPSNASCYTTCTDQSGSFVVSFGIPGYRVNSTVLSVCYDSHLRAACQYMVYPSNDNQPYLFVTAFFRDKFWQQPDTAGCDCSLLKRLLVTLETECRSSRFGQWKVFSVTVLLAGPFTVLVVILVFLVNWF